MSNNVITAFLKNIPFAVIVIGLLLFVIGAAGGWPNPALQINDLGWRIALAVMGTIVAGIGGLLLWGDNKSQQLMAPRGNKYGLKIVSPNKLQVEDVWQDFEIVGTCDQEPIRDSIQFFVIHGNQYWPIMRGWSRFTYAKNRWSAKVHIGGDPGPRTVIATVIGKAGCALCDYHWRAGDAGCWMGIEDITPFISECDRVIVNRK